MIIMIPDSGSMYGDWPVPVIPWIPVRLQNIIMVVKMLKMELFHHFYVDHCRFHTTVMVMIYFKWEDDECLCLGTINLPGYECARAVRL